MRLVGGTNVNISFYPSFSINIYFHFIEEVVGMRVGRGGHTGLCKERKKSSKVKFTEKSIFSLLSIAQMIIQYNPSTVSHAIIREKTQP